MPKLIKLKLNFNKIAITVYIIRGKKKDLKNFLAFLERLLALNI